MTIYYCKNQCCSIQIEYYNKINNYYNYGKKIKRTRVGVFIYDSKLKKVLLVQSCGYLWGIPKGQLENNETIQDGAIREVKEETGLVINKNLLNKYYTFKNAIYYILDLPECPVYVQSHLNNDANGITWININCLESLLAFQSNNLSYSNEIPITNHCKILIDKFVNNH